MGALNSAPAGPAVDVDRLSDFDLAMLKAAVVREEQRRYQTARLTDSSVGKDAIE